MRVIVCRVGEEPKYEEIDESLDGMQEVVHGFIEEFPLDADFSIVCNEEGKLNGMKPNRVVVDMPSVGMIFGDFFICRNGEDDFKSVGDGDLEKVIEAYGLEMA